MISFPHPFIGCLCGLLLSFIINKVFLKLDMKVSLEDFFHLFLAGFAYGMTSLTLFSSYNYLTGGSATSIHFIYPALIFILSSLIYRNRPTRGETIALILCAFGFFMLFDFSNSSSLRDIIFAVISAFTFAFYSIIVERSNISYMNVKKSLFYIFLTASLVIFVYTLIFKSPIYIDISFKDFLFLLFYAFILTLGATLMFQTAVIIGERNRYSFNSRTNGIINYRLFMGEKISLKGFVEIFFILCAAVYIIKGQKINYLK
ncbi:DMT family transporter [uncultured Peptoniphilus sp.]|uniref:DMT family transporter n=1 Tax=uncultured Peptoniphilus sp. TaxID=254354 RepID=UPI002804F468|nr:DMT family transporter [uncultured Peptoniphilus sp.]